jgi:chromosome transmission fidelity protein 8
MPSVPVYPLEKSRSPESSGLNPLPHLLQTPTGLAMVEIQGTINTPQVSIHEDSTTEQPASYIGNLEFPLYDASKPDDNAWMKQVYLYVGKHQRLTGQVKKLPKAIAVLRRKEPGLEALQITEIIKHKIVFSHRPEPVDRIAET